MRRRVHSSFPASARDRRTWDRMQRRSIQALKPQSIGEYSVGLEYEVARDVALGVRGIYRHMRNVIEDGSFDDGDTLLHLQSGTK